ncbi:glutathione S-transferase [Bradyrhizobium sp. LHD-71]|uniref:glutathione S-transferase family protein n=1 Tax=Bradyrhizobium sp. LHD-71 TaxID=3072141 RepID=UPI00280CDA57|nr:glutathione S-transferase [Bradyrhizobium sp. LHD-71]MDQ8726300.1 glutathione S-transferase [Bradyrhizobium sp. LHD-71]
MLKFYFAPQTCALASHIALIDAGAVHEAVFVSFEKEEQRKPEYLAINPKARVPSLVTDRGVLTETPAILAFIAQSWPQAKLAPTDPYQFAQAQAFNSYLCSTLHVAHAHRRRGYRWADEPSSFADMERKVPQTVGDCFSLVEQIMFKGPWVLGESYSICDPYLFTVARWIEGDGIDPAKFPKVAEHRRRMSERASVREALAVQEPRRS